MLVERALPDVLAFLDGEDVPGLSLRWRLAFAALTLAADVKDRVRGLLGLHKRDVSTTR